MQYVSNPYVSESQWNNIASSLKGPQAQGRYSSQKKYNPYVSQQQGIDNAALAQWEESQREVSSPAVPMTAYSGQAQPRQQSLGTLYGQSYSNLPGQWSPVQAAPEKPRTLQELQGSLATRAGNFQEDARSRVQADPYIQSLENQLAATKRGAQSQREAYENFPRTTGDMNNTIGRMGALERWNTYKSNVRDLERKLQAARQDTEARYIAEARSQQAARLGYDVNDPGVRFTLDKALAQTPSAPADLGEWRNAVAGSQYQYAPVTTLKRPDGSEVNRTYLPGMPLEQVSPADSPFGGQSGGFRQPQFFSSYTPPQISAQPQFRPSFQALYTNFDGSASAQPNYSLRDAFVQSINDSMIPYQTGRMSGAPQFDFQSLLGTARNMSNAGFQNPLAGLFG